MAIAWVLIEHGNGFALALALAERPSFRRVGTGKTLPLTGIILPTGWDLTAQSGARPRQSSGGADVDLLPGARKAILTTACIGFEQNAF